LGGGVVVKTQGLNGKWLGILLVVDNEKQQDADTQRHTKPIKDRERVVSLRLAEKARDMQS